MNLAIMRKEEVSYSTYLGYPPYSLRNLGYVDAEDRKTYYDGSNYISTFLVLKPFAIKFALSDYGGTDARAELWKLDAASSTVFSKNIASSNSISKIINIYDGSRISCLNLHHSSTSYTKHNKDWVYQILPYATL